jgi:branched-chain amino acid transport system substrate-binding protein
MRQAWMSALTGFCAALAGFAACAQGQVVVGTTFTATGPNAPIGLPGRNAALLYPDRIGGLPAKVVALDDGCDPTLATRNMRKLVEEDHADVIIGSSCTPACLALAEVAAERKVAQICMAPVSVKNPWAFFVPQPALLMTDAVIQHMKTNGVKTVAFIGFSDGWGDLNYDALVKLAPGAGIQVLSNERYARADTSVNAQILKIMALRPDAVYVGASAAPAALPSIALAERGYRGRVYQSPAVVNPDFLRVGGKSVEGVIAPTGPFAVRDQLPESNPTRAASLEFERLYNARYGAGSVNPFAAYAWDGYLWLQAAIPVAARKAAPGTPAFRAALRDALENLHDVAGGHGVYSTSAQDHNGVDERGRVLVRVEGGTFKLLP